MTTGITVYNKTSYDVAGEKTTDARYIGLLDPGRTVLNVDSALAGKDNDKQDTFRLRLTKDAPLGLTAIDTKGNASTAKIQILDYSGRVIADSSATSGTLKDNYKAIAGSTYAAKRGDYYVRIQHPAGEATTKDLQYSLQIRSGFTYRDDYTTTEKRQTTSATGLTGAAGAASSLAAQITTQTNALNADTETFAQKLLGSLV